MPCDEDEDRGTATRRLRDESVEVDGQDSKKQKTIDRNERLADRAVPPAITFGMGLGGCAAHTGGCECDATEAPTPLQAKPLVKGCARKKGDVFVTAAGNYKRWSGKQWISLCRDCARVGSHSAANYEDEEGRKKKLCAACARKAGTWGVQNPCRDCPADAKRDAGYEDEEGRANKLCGPCARKAGTWTAKNPCRDCPADAKWDASYKDEEGRANKLCAACARKAGTWTAKNPCRDCPADAKREANYEDEEGRANKLCAACARRAGTWKVLNPCRDCPADAKRDAHYEDEEGRVNKLCAPCARKAGTWKLRYPCRDCPADAKREAAYEDEEGRANKLCAPCAVAAGTHVDTGYTGASYEACRCFCRLQRALKTKLPHVHYLLGGGHEGAEQTGLLPEHPQMTPDVFVSDPTGASRGLVFQFHGNEWHGYPPGHPKAKSILKNGMLASEAYEQTNARDRRYLDAGYRVFQVWGHEFAECERAVAPRDVRDVCREVF